MAENVDGPQEKEDDKGTKTIPVSELTPLQKIKVFWIFGKNFFGDLRTHKKIILFLNTISVILWIETLTIGFTPIEIPMVLLTFVILVSFADNIISNGLTEFLNLYQIEKPTIKQITIGVVLFLFGFLASVIIPEIFPTLLQITESSTDHAFMSANPSQSVIVGFSLFILAVIGAPLFEELLFRHWIQKKLLKKFSKNTIIRVCIASILFSIAHVLVYGITLSTVPILVSIFILGFSFGVAYELTDNLTIPILMHSLRNGISVFAILFIV